MKKQYLATAAAIVLAAALSGCGTSTGSETDAPAASGQGTSAESMEAQAEGKNGTEETQDTAQPGAETSEGSSDGSSQILVAYYSWSGNTEQIADMIAKDTNGTLFAIEPEEAYPSDYNTVVDQAKKEQQEDARPALAAEVENFDDYEVIFLGYPNWWSDVPMLMKTFMEAYDFSGKTVVPFCTHGGGGFGRSLESVKEGCKGATILDGFEVGGSNAANAGADVQAWIDSLGLGD